MSGTGGATIIDSLVVTLGLDATDFLSTKDRAKEATAAIAASVAVVDKASEKAAKEQAKRDKEAATLARQNQREADKATREQDRTREQAYKENERRDKQQAQERLRAVKSSVAEEAKKVKDFSRLYDQAVRENERRNKKEQAEEAKARTDDLRDEKQVERERTLEARKAAKERQEGYTKAKEAALGFAAVAAEIVAGKWITDAAENVAALGREAHNLDLPTGEVVAWGNAIASSVGGSAQAAIGTLAGLQDSLVRMRTMGDQSLLPLIAQLDKFSGLNINVKGPDGKFLGPEELMTSISRAGAKMDPAVFSSLLRGNGFDQGTINFLEKGPDAVQAELAAARKRGVPNDKEAAEDQKLTAAATQLEQAFSRLGQQLVFNFGPDLIRFLNDFSSLLSFLSGKTSWSDFKKERAQHWHDLEVDRLQQKGMSPADAERTAAEADKEDTDPTRTNSKQPGAFRRGLDRFLGVRSDPAYPEWKPDTHEAYGPPDPTRPPPFRRWLDRTLGIQHDPAYPNWKPPAASGADKPSPNLPADIEAEVRKDALAAGADPDHMVALFRTEAGGYDKVSSAGAMGPAQLMPDTARMIGLPTSVKDPNYDWRDNVIGGMRVYMALLKRFNGNKAAADAAYNAGPGGAGVQRFYASGDDTGLPAETQHYIRQIQTNLSAPGVTAPVAGASHNDNSTTSSVTIGKMDVHTQAKDSDAIVAGMHDAMKNHPLMVQANTGQE